MSTGTSPLDRVRNSKYYRRTFGGLNTLWLPLSETDTSKTSPLFEGCCWLDLMGLERNSTEWISAKNEDYFRERYSPPAGCDHHFNKTKINGTTRLYYAFSSEGSPSDTIAFLESSAPAKRALGSIYSLLLPDDFDSKMHVDPPTIEAPKTRSMDRGLAQTTPRASKKRKGDDDNNNNRYVTKKAVNNAINQYTPSPASSTTSSRQSDARDAETVALLVKRLRSSKENQLKLLTVVMKKLDLDNGRVSEENEKLALGAREMAARSKGGRGRPPKVKDVVTTFIATTALLGAALKEHKSENDDMDDGQPKPPPEITTSGRELVKDLGISKRIAGTAESIAGRMLDTGAPYTPQHPTLSEHALNHARFEIQLKGAFDKFLHDEDHFPFDNNLRNALLGGIRAKDLKRRGTLQGGEVHQARSRGNKTNADILDLYHTSVHHNALSDECKTGCKMTLAKVPKLLCPCIRHPQSQVCVDPFVANAERSVRCLNNVLKNFVKTSSDNDSTEIKQLVGDTGRLNTFYRAGMCNYTTVNGLDIEGEAYEAPGSLCAYSCCEKCGITRHLNSVLTDEMKASIVNNLLEKTKSTTLTFPRFENVRTETKDGHYDSMQEVAKLVTFEELLDVVKHDVMELNSHLYRDRFHKRSWKRLGEHRPMTTATAIVDWASAIMLGGLAEMTCSSRPFCYNEVYVVSIKGPLLSDGDANYRVYYNEVFSFLTEATGINKDNDHKAHEVHLAVVAKHVKDNYNCTELVIQSDQAPGYMNRCQAVNIGLSSKRWGIHVSHAFSEPYCGKSAADAANNIAQASKKKYQNLTDKTDDPPLTTALDLFDVMKKEKAPHGAEYQKLVKNKDVAGLNALKSVPFSAFNVFCTTSNLGEYEERKKGGDEARMLFVDRETRVSTTHMPNVREFRLWESATTREGGCQLVRKPRLCGCGGCLGVNGVRNCTIPAISEVGRQEKMVVTRVEQKAVAAITFDLEGKRQVLGKKGKMSMFEVTSNSHGDPMVCKDSANPARVGVKDVVAVSLKNAVGFTGKWGIGVITNKEDCTFEVNLLALDAEKTDKLNSITVGRIDVKLCAQHTKNAGVLRVIVDEANRKKLTASFG